MPTPFKEQFSFDRRKAESTRIRQKYTDRIPIICERATGANVQDINKIKYLAPPDLTVGQFIQVVRKRVKLPSERAMFLFVNDEIPSVAAALTSVYESQKDEDGFLYVKYASENTFGARLKN